MAAEALIGLWQARDPISQLFERHVAKVADTIGVGVCVTIAYR